jgi:hypothetical protein
VSNALICWYSGEKVGDEAVDAEAVDVDELGLPAAEGSGVTGLDETGFISRNFTTKPPSASSFAREYFCLI